MESYLGRRSFVCLAGASLAVTGCVGGMSVTSSFDEGDEIPVEHTCDGEGASPPLEVENVPEGAETLAVVADDPDAPGGTFVHWLLWNVSAEIGNVPGGVRNEPTLPSLGGARQGENDADSVGYEPACPPEGDGEHTYRLTVHAVGEELSLGAGEGRDALESALDGSTVGRARLTGVYSR